MYKVACVVFVLLFHAQCEANVINLVDFEITQFKEHHTDEFYAKGIELSQVIVRRGTNFRFKTIFKEGNNVARIYIQLSFATERDEFSIKLPHYLRYSWHLRQTKNNQGIAFDLHIPGNAPVGTWKMVLFVKGKNGKIIEEYHVPNKIIMLFNPWSREDAAYFHEANKLKEYVLDETGHLYLMKGGTRDYMKWIFGQFQHQILDSILFILDGSGLCANERGDIVKVTRSLTHLLNYFNVYHPGVLVGRWQEPYDDYIFGQRTTNPMAWTGSADILRKYYTTKGVPVGFGQCWVYAGLLTTVLRALGIASRPVANFGSAHDNGPDLTVDTYLDETGKVNRSASDSVWNFHEWVQGYFRRDDLRSRQGEWQQLDATPQSFNDGELQVGPAPISSILNPRLFHNYETDYLYSEVNADQVVWSYDKQIKEIKHDNVGLAILTKKFDQEEAEDITSQFKPQENTEAERNSYRAAAKSLNIVPPSLKQITFSTSKGNEMLSISITPIEEVNVGSTVNIELLVKSKYSQKKEVSVILQASSIYYNGKFNALIKNETRKITVPALRHRKVIFSIQSEDYIELLTSMRTIFVEAVVIYEKQIYHVDERIFLKTSELLILAPKEVNYNSKFKLIVKFKNPLSHSLKNCRIAVEGKGIKRKVVKLSDVHPFATENIALQLSSKYWGSETIVISLHNDILKDIFGHVQLQVKGQKRHAFAMYTRNSRRHSYAAPVANRLSAKDEETALKSKQNENIVTTDMFTCCKRVAF